VTALNVMHTHNINHGDLRPEKILVDQDGNIRLTEIGLTRGIKEMNVEVNSFAFLSVEQMVSD
jgi:serine/threonine protein kinase